MKNLGEKLKHERLKRNWTLKEAARRLGLKGHSTYSNWEYGVREPDKEMLSKLADIYEVSTDYLLGRTDEQTHKNNTTIERESEDESIFFFDQEKITPEEREELKKHLEFLRYKAAQENEKKKD